MIKRLSSLLILLLIGIAAMTASAASLIVKEKTHNFGTIREADGAVTCDFILQNNGTKPIIIVSAKAQCGCTTPKIPKEPIRAGESAKLSVTYNPVGRPGEFDKTIRVKTNIKGENVVLKIKGTVLPKSTPSDK
jgi:hypothetical protein